jgi:phage tail tube protein FII
MAKLYVPEAFNLFAGAASDTEASKHLSITENTFPKLDEKTVEHHPGGSIGAIEIGGLGLNALSHGFKLSGVDPQTMALFGVANTTWTSYAVLRDKQGNAPVEWRVVETGRLVTLENDALKRGDLQSQTHMIKEIMHYEMYVAGQELYFYDFWSSTWRVNGVDQNQASNAILRIPGA